MTGALKGIHVYQVTQETPCAWMVKSMTLLPRQEFKDVPFLFLENGTAVALKWGQILTVKDQYQYATTRNLVFIGSGFIPETVVDFTKGYSPVHELEMIGHKRNHKICDFHWNDLHI
uniref:Uncharacterized protein n=1 Tax=Caenorhabditis tropicalis TaxID=1561998 RepID=A0A1I7TDC7_9PELO